MDANIRITWNPDLEAALHGAVLKACNGKFINLLQMPGNKRKLFKRKLSYGWEEVKQLLAKEYPDFKPSRLQVAGKWHKSKYAQQVMSSSTMKPKRSAIRMNSDGQMEEQDPLHHIDWLRESEDANYSCAHEIAKKQGTTDSSVRALWCPKAEASLRNAVSMANDGKFLELLEMPEHVKKGRTQELFYGWEEVRQIMAEEHPEFEPTRSQIASKWRTTMAADKSRRAKLTVMDSKEEMQNMSSSQQLRSSSFGDFDNSEMPWDNDDDSRDYVDANSGQRSDKSFLRKGSQSKNFQMMKKKKMELIEDETLAFKKREERVLEIMEEEHEKRMAFIQEQSDLRKQIIKEAHESNLFFFEKQLKGKL